ncbi:spheroidene monooxygenase [Jannaschia sp. LMIT008]|uniref:spheroidene monooxygenase n=1 Tax=Jannaschia maritima TaxID=3032585 RepID=UPI002812270A|nr:spheroidene monooxygenase [Jannaschia sp. LMIT008]
MQIATLTLCRFDGWADRVWAFAQMGLARGPLRRAPGLRFFKLLGSGAGSGFAPVPNTAVWAILAVWDDADAARRGLSGGVFARWHARADECAHLTLSTLSARGAWSGVAPFQPGATADDGPIVALTRATIRARALPRFWRRVPHLDDLIGDNGDVLMKVGVGEVPWLHQITVSVWPDAASMARFARVPGPHADAIRAVREGGWFAEELYARFRILDASGIWQGRPLRDALT